MEKENGMKMSRFDYIFEGILVVFVAITAIICILPFLHVLATSLSDSQAVNSGAVGVLPVNTTLEAYKKIFKDPQMMRSLWFSIFLTLMQVAISLTMTVAMAYPLSRKNFKWRKWMTIFILITMYFSGGTIPSYLLIQNLGLLDTIWSITIPGAISVYNLIVMRSFFNGIPDSLVESIKIDGGSEIRALVSIVLPLSKPVLATMALFYGVSRWNGYSDILYYIQNPNLQTLQMRLQQIIAQNQMVMDVEEMMQNQGSYLETETLKSACLIFATIPILIMYPFLQKYFVKGMAIGSIKG
ncbi:MAG: carbohydrate ABC transporter permease [Candidatus Merdivicinus sp.]|jgi:putative aldouronate transport system permease protein